MIKINLKLLFNYNIHIGYNKGRWNPKISLLLFGTRNNIHIINLTNTLYMLRRVSFFIEQIIVNFGLVLFLNNVRFGLNSYFLKKLISYGQYVVNHRYSGGLLTNFKNVKAKYKSLRGLFRLPSVVFTGSVSNILPIHLECKKLGIPLIGICDTNIDPSYFNYPIPGNNDSLLAIKFYYKFIFQSIFRGILRKRIIFKKKRYSSIYYKNKFLKNRRKIYSSKKLFNKIYKAK